MSIALRVPQIGESVAEVQIGQWSKLEGQQVERDETLVELESEKATLDFPAPSDGVLSKILKQSGETASVGDVIAYIDDNVEQSTSGDDSSALTLAAAPSTTTAPTAPAAEQTTVKAAAPVVRSAKQFPPLPPEQRPTPAEPQSSQADGQSEDRDVSGREERVRMSPVRLRIAAHLVEAQQTAALLSTFSEIDMTALKSLRDRHGEAFRRKHGVRLGLMSFFVKATIGALKDCAELNASVDGDDIVYHRYFDVGVAISSPKGLVVPVLRSADRLSFAEIERSIADLAVRARDATLKVDELRGGTFTITNGGVFGSLLSTPIVNPPQSGVLAMHAIQDRPIAVEGQVAVRPMMYVALTYDHRIVDGREAVTFLKRIKETIEDPARELIDV